MKQKLCLALLSIFLLFKTFSAEMDVSVIANNFGESFNAGIYVNYIEVINDYSKLNIAFYSPSFIYNEVRANFNYLFFTVFNVTAGPVFKFEPGNIAAGMDIGLGLQTPQRTFYFECNTTIYTGFTNTFAKQNYDAKVKIGWEGTNFKTSFAYRYERKNNADGILSAKDCVDFYVRFFDVAVPIFGEIDTSAFVDFRNFTFADLKFYAKLKIGFVNESGGEYYGAIEYNQKNSVSSFPIGVTAGWKCFF